MDRLNAFLIGAGPDAWRSAPSPWVVTVAIAAVLALISLAVL